MVTTRNLRFLLNRTTKKRFLCKLKLSLQIKKNETTYIGYNTTTFTRRLTCHLLNQSPMRHRINKQYAAHSNTRLLLRNNTKTLAISNSKNRLKIFKIIHIKSKIYCRFWRFILVNSTVYYVE